MNIQSSNYMLKLLAIGVLEWKPTFSVKGITLIILTLEPVERQRSSIEYTQGEDRLIQTDVFL